jgi:hypothetical protein
MITQAGRLARSRQTPPCCRRKPPAGDAGESGCAIEGGSDSGAGSAPKGFAAKAEALLTAGDEMELLA